MNILVAGGLGYIGSHVVLDLLKAGHDIFIVDNLCNSTAETKEKIERISGKSVRFSAADIRDEAALNEIFRHNALEAVFHFAGLKAVGESALKPLEYYDNNVYGTVCLLKAASLHNVKKLVFSSSATVYGDGAAPYKESDPLKDSVNPYGRTKQFIEHILRDLYLSDNEWSIAILRYFNPIGAHESGLIGEKSNGVPNNLLPYIASVAKGGLDKLQIFGNDYPTPDGTCIRDYIHIMDLASGHVKALERINDKSGVFVWNLGTGKGCSVLEVVNTFMEATKKRIPYIIVSRRKGDVAESWSDPSKAERELGWKAERTLETMLSDLWKWESGN